MTAERTIPLCAAVRQIGHIVFLLWSTCLLLLAQPAVLDEVFFHPIATNVRRVVAITHAGDGSGRLFLTQQQGKIVIHNGEQLLEEAFFDIESRATCCGENGLLSVAFHPDFEKNGFFYVFYNNLDGDAIVSRFRVSSDPNVADLESEKNILVLDKRFERHNGGQLAFGPDGYLYISVGDDGEAGDNFNNGQDLSTLFGAIFRIDVDNGDPYSVPETNPFVDHSSARPEIWAYGLRNPWRFSFDRLTGDMFVGDVGQAEVEEVDLIPAGTSGQNFGWRLMEGSLCFNEETDCSDGTLTPPILEYPHRDAPCGGSVIGGYRYRGGESPPLAGMYLHADYCTGLVYAATDASGSWASVATRQTDFIISSFGEDEAGEVFLADLRDHTVLRISTNRPPPSVTAVSPSTTVAGGPGVELIVGGMNFETSHHVEWNGQPRETEFYSENRLQVALLESDIAVPEVAQLTVVNPGDNAAVSAPVDFVVREVPAAAPVVTANGLVDAAAFLADRAVSPGSLATLFGTDLAVGEEEAVMPPPLPTSMAGTRVLFDGIEAAQSFVSSGQVNLEVPWELVGKPAATLTVHVGSRRSAPVTVPLAATSPALFTLDALAQGVVLLAEDLAAGLFAAPESFPLLSRPARSSDFIVIWGTGLGAVTNQPPSGRGAGELLAVSTETPVVRIGGILAPVLFSGLAPGFPGLYQVNARIPPGAPGGDRVPLTLTIDGRSSNQVTIAVE